MVSTPEPLLKIIFFFPTQSNFEIILFILIYVKIILHNIFFKVKGFRTLKN